MSESLIRRRGVQKLPTTRLGVADMDFDRDTLKPSGRLVAHLMVAVAEFERDRIRERTREAFAEVRAKGGRLGRPRSLPGKVVQRIMRERGGGQTLQAIADRLNRDEVRTAHGGARWWPSTVWAVLRSEQE